LTFYLILSIFILKEELTMTTAEMDVKTGLDDVPEDDTEYEYVYPPELINHWFERAEIMDAKIASGELKPQSVEEVAAKYGVILD
jgi:hypothetical protein